MYILTTPTDELFFHMTDDFEKALTEKGIPHEYHVYMGIENNLGHTFNIGNVEYMESIRANQAAIEYLQGLCR